MLIVFLVSLREIPRSGTPYLITALLRFFMFHVFLAPLAKLVQL